MNLQTANGGLERLRQLNELLAREEKVDAVYRHLWSATDLGVALVADEGQFLDCNEAYAQILGRKINDVLGETWQSMTPEPDRSIDQAKVDACLRGESEGYFLLKRYEIDGTGKYSYNMISVRPVWVGSKFLYFFVVCVPINFDELKKQVGQIER